MKSFGNRWKGRGAVALGAALALTSVVLAQDYGTLGGNNARTGRNTGAVLNNAGRAFLRWYQPVVSDALGRTLIRNNSSSETAVNAPWLVPTLDEEAFGAYTPAPAVPTTDPVNVGENLIRGLDPLTAPLAGYVYSPTIPSAAGFDPTAKNFGADADRQFTWTVEPPTGAFPNQRLPRNYALSVWVPAGPTLVGATLQFPSRFWVYRIQYGNGQTFTDVVDTYQGGTGWVRLGNGGRQTTRVFAYDGVNPIRITLYNTLPRRPGRENDLVSGPAHPWLSTYFDAPYNTLVYADAVKAEPVSGIYVSSPLVSEADSTIVAGPVNAFAAKNIPSVDGASQSGEVVARNSQTGAQIWQWAPGSQAFFTTQVDNTSASVTVTLPWQVPGTLEPGFLGTDYVTAPITNTAGTEQATRFEPNLANDDYDISVYIPGSRGAENLARAVRYEIHEGTVVTPIILNQDAASGWVTLGNRPYRMRNGAPLRVYVTNLSADPGDLGRFAYADQVRFTRRTNTAINSTPVAVTANVISTVAGTPAPKGVLLVAAEDGRIYCLDAVGNGDGTTNVYWAYPSLPDPNVPSWTDPNHVAGEDGPSGLTENPGGFDLSSALVQNIGGADFLYIASLNGRVYCLEMAGRGDMNFTTRQPGTTRRVWTYPNDYPAAQSRSNLGPFRGSISYAQTTAGPTIFVPARQGRLYALNAQATNVAAKTTSVRWTYPARTATPDPAILTAPLAANGRVFYGTEIDTNGFSYVRALNWDTGALVWTFSRPLGGEWGTDASESYAANFALAPAGELGVGEPEVLFFANQNRWITAVNATNGALYWTSNELLSGVNGGLNFLELDVFINGGGGSTGISPVLMVPTADGRFSALYARAADLNRFGTRLAWEYGTPSDSLIAGTASGRGFVSGADTTGFHYMFDNQGNGSGGDVDGPGQRTIVPNDDTDPNVEAFRDARIVFINEAMYRRLRLPLNDSNLPTRTQATDPAVIQNRTHFDWGEVIYVLVYNFPYLDTYQQGALAGSAAPPPVVNFQTSVEGQFVRNLSVEARRFAPGGPALPNGYAVLAFILQGSGSNALPPGGGRFSFSISSTALTDPPRAVNVAPNPASAVRPFAVANPLAVIARFENNGTFLNANTVGNNIDPSAADNVVNGTPNPALMTDTLATAHGGTARAFISVIDRSLMTNLRGPGNGLDSVRFDRTDLAWAGGKAQVRNRLDSIPFYAALYPLGRGLEDYPENFPNDSVDYPDILRERITVTKDPNGNAENPLFNAISLRPVTNVDMNAPGFPSRTLNPTPFEVGVNVPRFQPANRAVRNNAAGTAVEAGFFGQLLVFIDSNGDGNLSREGGRREAYRSLGLGTGVPEDQRLSIGVENIDFGSLAGTTGYDPVSPQTGTFSPWAGPFQDLFKPLTIRNEGNVNLLDIRLAKAFNNGSTQPWPVLSSGGHEAAWLNGSLNLHATFDSQFSLTPVPVLPKARVGDLNPTEFRDNPRVRSNSNINAVAGPVLPASPDPDQPRVAVTTPFGFPVGLYQSIIRVIADQGAAEVDEGEIADDVVARFLARETRATNSFTTRTAPMIDDFNIGTANFMHSNIQPAGTRSLTGDLIMAFASDRFSSTGAGTGFDRAFNPTKQNEPQYRLYVSGVQGATPSGTPLSDLNAFTPTAGRWADRSVAEYPTTPLITLFPGDPVVPNTGNFGAPAFPTAGFANPFGGANHSFSYMAFNGLVQKQGTNERYVENKVFVARATVTNGQVTLTDPVPFEIDPRVRKGRVAVLQSGNNATVFFTSGGTGQSQIHYATYDGTTAPDRARVLNTGSGFESVGAPSVSGRVYEGLGGTNAYPATGTNLIEVAFAGKLRGRAAADVYYGRMAANGQGSPTRQLFLPPLTREELVADVEPGVFRSGGVVWNQAAAVTLEYQAVPGGPVVNVETGNRTFDRATGILSFDTSLGGRAYLDPALGTVRLRTSLPARGGALLLSYQPMFVRVSRANAAYAAPQVMFDDRRIGEFGYWATQSGAGLAPLADVRPGRLVFGYSRAAETNQPGRPYWTSLRSGIQLPLPVNTTAQGNLVSLSVTGNTGPYQVDPVRGRIYVTAADENRVLSVTYEARNPNTGATQTLNLTGLLVSLLFEKDEAPAPIEQVSNESQAWFFLDPFMSSSTVARPGLIWMMWTSTRAGTSDIFYQTFAPRFTPVLQ